MERSLLYIEEIEHVKVKELMFGAHQLILALVPQIQSVFKWQTAFFDYCGKNFCYLNIHKDHIYISFMDRDNALKSDKLAIQQLKVVSKVFIPDMETLHSDAIAELIIHAAILHERKYILR